MASQTRNYGFDCAYHGYFDHDSLSGNNVVDFRNDPGEIEGMTCTERRARRQALENEAFSYEHYGADFMDADALLPALEYRVTVAPVSVSTIPTAIQLADHRNVYLVLASALFGFVYNERFMEGEDSSEAPWTVGRLVPALASADAYIPDVRSLKLDGIRRALIYPLYRNWELALACWCDVARILRGGVPLVTGAVQKMQEIFAQDETTTLFNVLYFDDYAAWIRTGARDGVLSTLADALDACHVCKDDVGLDLCEIESAVKEGPVDMGAE